MSAAGQRRDAAQRGAAAHDGHSTSVFQLIHLRLCSINACPAQRTNVAISRRGGCFTVLCPLGRECDASADWQSAEIALGQMQIDVVTSRSRAQAVLDGAQSARLQKMGRETMS